MARFGHLFARKGDWNGKQIVPAAWVQEATGQSSTPLNAAYGYLWWLNRKGRIASPMQATTADDTTPVVEGQFVPTAPDDVFWALGYADQIIAVFPSSGVVTVRLGPVTKPPGATAFTVLDATVGTQAALGGQ
jgi:CubicO group peptidase (beta-lactamase class C family)